MVYFYFFLLLINIIIVSGTIDCNVPGYDLSPLLSYGQINASDQKNHWNYTVSICQNIIPSCDICPLAGYCQRGNIDGKNYSYCVGTFESIVEKTGGFGVVLQYNEKRVGRAGKITISCLPGGPLVANAIAISPDKITAYEFQFDSSAACLVCSLLSNCSSCTKSSCTWCLETRTCVPNNTPCRNFVRDPTVCPLGCDAKTNCRDCTTSVNGSCVWCLDTNSCVSNTFNCRNYVKDPTFCPPGCVDKTNCNDCTTTDNGKCAWCLIQKKIVLMFQISILVVVVLFKIHNIVLT